MSEPAHPTLPEPSWVFGYGSLIWNPGFAYRRAHLARLHGYRRAFCIRSARYRGTPQEPGIVLGLARGGSCIGMAFELDPAHSQDAVRALFEREMPGGFYVPRMVQVHPIAAESRQQDRSNSPSRCGRGEPPVQAMTFVANTASAAFSELSEQEILRRLIHCAGERGPNIDYALRTHESLRHHGVRCSVLERIARQLALAESSATTRPGTGP